MAAQPYKAFEATFTLSPACPITDGVYHVIGQLTPEIYEVIAVARIGALEAGGTKMVMAIGDEEGHILERDSVPTTAPEECVPPMVEWFRERNIDALGIGAFGPTCVDPANKLYGSILETPKTAWRYYNFRNAFVEGLHIPVGYDTDVNVACLGEAGYGAAKGLDYVVYVTIGTGIGAGVMVEGKLMHGMMHPEAGHILLKRDPEDTAPSNCPYHDDCFEGLAAGPAIQKHWGKPAAELTDNPRVWDLESYYLAQGLMTYILCYSPKKIVLGGGVMHQEQLFPLVRSKVARMMNGYIVTPQMQDLDSYIVSAGCNGDQGILGSLELGKKALAEA